MADKHTSESSQQACSSILSREIGTLASKRLDALGEKSRREKVAKILDRKRKKWRKRQKLEPPTPQELDLLEQKSHLEDITYDLVKELVKRRDDGLEEAMHLQSEENLHTLDVFRYRLANENRILESYLSRSHPQQEPIPPSPLNPDYMGIIKDLEATISQVEAVAEIRKMRSAPITRVPQLQNRTLSGSILNQSLGILHDGGELEDSDIASDSEHAHLQIIGEEVSISEGGGDAEILDSDHAHMHITSQEDPMSGKEGGGCVSPEKLPCSDDTPGIGMEVVCVEGMDSSVASTQPLCELETIISSQNGYVNETSAAFAAIQQQHSSGKVRAGPSSRSAVEDEPAPPNGELQLKILQLIQDSHYDLRFPVQRYSSHASRGGKTGTRRSAFNCEARINGVPETSPCPNRILPSTSATREKGDVPTPAPRKRGRPRKYPVLDKSSQSVKY